MGKPVQEITPEIAHFVAGFSDNQPAGVIDFLSLRCAMAELKTIVDKKWLINCAKSKAKKADWIEALISMPMLERRELVMRNPMLVPLLPRDIKNLGSPRVTPCGSKTFNPGRTTHFNVYGLFDTLSNLSARRP